jgi:hypothetical protein
MIDAKEIRQWIILLNDGSDNKEYLRGQIELAMALLGYTYDDEKLVNELIGKESNA